MFGYVSDPDPQYIERARQLAAGTISGKGFARSNWARGAPVADVRSLFGYSEARPLQRAAASAPLDRPLLILESETGSGKTEAALLRFAALWRSGIVDGLYFAVPTRAAAKQLHARVGEALNRLYPRTAKVETVMAVPGYLIAGGAEGRRVGRFSVLWEDQPDEEQRQARWAAESARKFLNAPAAVGTVDQALLAGLRVKWSHFRAAALARSLLVVDEVHASDAYMTELLAGVLRGHLALGGHALLMSATLGAAASAKFIAECPRHPTPSQDEAEAAPYPTLTLAGGLAPPQVVAIAERAATKTVVVTTKPVLADPCAIAREALAAALDGAKVLLIRNTVRSAQAVFEELLAQGGGELALRVSGGPALHHSRFAAEDRKLLDDAVEQAIGKDERHVGGVVVVGTQTLEQSLDIDADFLISDICPVDVLLQRIGRLHRHDRTDRPPGFGEARCTLLVPDGGLAAGLDGSLLKHGLGTTERGGIYENLVVLEATRRLVEEQSPWVIPSMNRLLVERATHPEALEDLGQELGEKWLSHLRTVLGQSAARRIVARNHALTREERFDEELVFPDIDTRVRTRLGDDGPRVELPAPVPGPFDSDVQTFNLPAHLFGSALPTKDEIEAARAERGQPAPLVLTVGSHRLTYDRMGVRPEA